MEPLTVAEDGGGDCDPPMKVTRSGAVCVCVWLSLLRCSVTLNRCFPYLPTLSGLLGLLCGAPEETLF